MDRSVPTERLGQSLHAASSNREEYAKWLEDQIGIAISNVL